MLKENKEYPMVSVIVPAYNHEKYIEQCLNSIIGQTYPNIEIIVINDGSTDGTLLGINKFKDVKNLKIINQQNIGLCKTLNVGIDLAKGKYIAIVASDDYWIANKIEKQVFFMEKYPEFGMCCAKAYEFTEDQNIVGVAGLVNNVSELRFENLINGNKIAALTVLIKKDVLLKVGYFDENLYMEDWDMWLRISNKYKIGFLDEFVAYYRRHSTNISSKVILMETCKMMTLAKWKNLINYNNLYRKQALKSFNELAGKDKINAIKFMKTVFPYSYDPYFFRGILKLIIKW